MVPITTFASFFFFKDTAPPEIYPLSLHDPLPIFPIAVSDPGPGIPAADLPHVFDKFYRVKSRATEGTPGTGLGLAIVKSIVDLHRGRVRVESAEDAGSTFFVDLPLGDR